MLEPFLSILLAIKFGELDISNSTVIFLCVIAIFVFGAVGLSSFKLIQTAFDKEED